MIFGELAPRVQRRIAVALDGAGGFAINNARGAQGLEGCDLLRNAVHHGVEPPAEREQLGKVVRATVRLTAGRERGEASIAVEDDGRGLDPDAVARHAIDCGVVSAGDVDRLDRSGRLDLVFRSGFSTATDVSDVSGRGVGLDVVARSAAALGGTVEVRSTPGAGASFRLRVPVSIAFAAVLLVDVAGEWFALSVGGLGAAVDEDDLAAQPMDARRPVVALADLLALPRRSGRATGTVLVVESGERQVGLMVDRALRVEEIVVRQLGSRFARYPGVSGATMLGDGRVVPILDTGTLVRWALETAHWDGRERGS